MFVGTDATEAFEDIGHSTDAREMLKTYLIGKLVKVISEEDSAKMMSKEQRYNFSSHSVATAQ